MLEEIKTLLSNQRLKNNEELEKKNILQKEIKENKTNRLRKEIEGLSRKIETSIKEAIEKDSHSVRIYIDREINDLIINKWPSIDGRDPFSFRITYPNGNVEINPIYNLPFDYKIIGVEISIQHVPSENYSDECYMRAYDVIEAKW